MDVLMYIARWVVAALAITSGIWCGNNLELKRKKK